MYILQNGYLYFCLVIICTELSPMFGEYVDIKVIYMYIKFL